MRFYNAIDLPGLNFFNIVDFLIVFVMRSRIFVA